MRSSNIFRFGLVAGLLLLAGLAVAQTHGPIIDSDERVYDFGKRMDSVTLEHTFQIDNEGDTTLVIEEVRSSCGCSVADLSNNSIPPGKSAEFHAEVDLSGRRGVFKKHFTLISNALNEEKFQLFVEGEVTPSLDISPRHLFFRKIDKSEVAELTSTITYNSKTQFVGSVETDAEFLEADLEVLEPGRKYEITAKTRPPLSPEQRNAYIEVRDKAGSRLFTIPVWLQIHSPISVNPRKIDLSGEKGDLISRTIVVKGEAGKDFEIEKVELPNSEIESEIERLPGFGYRIKLTNIRLSNDLEGKQVVIATDVEGMDPIALPFRLGGSE